MRGDDSQASACLCRFSALHYRPFQLYHSLMLVQEYGVWDKVLFGTDYPFTTVESTLNGMRRLNDMLEGTKLPRLNMDKMEQMFERDTLKVLGISVLVLVGNICGEDARGRLLEAFRQRFNRFERDLRGGTGD